MIDFIERLVDSMFGDYMYQQAPEISKNGISLVILTDVPWYELEKDDGEATKKAGDHSKEEEEEYIYGKIMAISFFPFCLVEKDNELLINYFC